MIEDKFAATVRKYPEHVAISDGLNTITYYELNSQKQGCVQYLRQVLHVKKGERIALFLPNCIEFIFLFFAIADVGAIAVPLNIHLKENELQYYIVKCGITVVVTNSELLTQWGKMPSQGQGIKFILIDRLDISQQKMKDMLSMGDHLRHSGATSVDTDVLYISTSGSTGRPHIVSRTHANIVSGGENVGKALEITSYDRFLSVTPFFHANGFSNCMILPLLKGATIVLMRTFSPRETLHLLKEKDITIFVGSPFIFSTLTDVADQVSLPSLRFCLSTGAPLTEHLKRRFFDKFSVRLRQLYGASETGTVSVELKNQHGEGSVGMPIDNVQLKVIDDYGVELHPFETGEIIVRSPAMTKGYVGEPDLNRKVFHNGCFRTGDLGMLDDRGSIFIMGRKKKFINASGIKVDPVEIETILLSFHKVREAHVFGMKNERGTEIIKATLVAQKDCTVQEIIRYCKNKLADFKMPRIIEFKDNIPKDVLGKIILY
jgi:long-chain acyl-CoA synthetase